MFGNRCLFPTVRPIYQSYIMRIRIPFTLRPKTPLTHLHAQWLANTSNCSLKNGPDQVNLQRRIVTCKAIGLFLRCPILFPFLMMSLE